MEPSQRTAVVVEDDGDIRDLLATVLTHAGFTVHAVGTGLEGVAKAREVAPIIVTLDLSLPDIDGFEVARRIRTFSDAYVVMLTAHADEIDTLMGLEAGADDYLTKPFRPRELRARVAAMLRRPRSTETTSVAAAGAAVPGQVPVPAAPAPGPAPVETREPAAPRVGRHAAVADRPAPSETGGAEPTGTPAAPGDDVRECALVVDIPARTVSIEGEEVAVTKSEFDILAHLVENVGHVVSKSALVRTLWGDSYDSGTLIGPADHRSIEVHMANLRRKIGDDSLNPRWIDTVRGVGYRFRPRG